MRRIIGLLFLTLSGVIYIQADEPEVIGWRHDGTSLFPEAAVADDWSKAENIIWQTKMDAWSNASPVVLKERIIILEEPTAMVCLNRSDGRILWRSPLDFASLFAPEEQAVYKKAQTEGAAARSRLNDARKKLRSVQRRLRKEKDNQELISQVRNLEKEVKDCSRELDPYRPYMIPPTHSVAGYASNTPVSDGKHVYVFYGTETVACYDIEGRQKWVRRIEPGVPTQSDWGHSSSMAMADGMVFAHINKMHALDAVNGDILWSTPTRVGWGTPIPVDVDGLTVLVSDSGEILRASDGKVLTASPLNRLENNSACIVNGIAYFIQANSTAYRLERIGETIKTELLWKQSIPKDRYYASPLIYDGLIYAMARRGLFTVMDAETGEVQYTKTFKFGKGEFYPSPVLLGDRIFFAHETGTVVLIKPGREYKELRKFKIEPFRSTPVALDNRLYLRGRHHMLCIGSR